MKVDPDQSVERILGPSLHHIRAEQSQEPQLGESNIIGSGEAGTLWGLFCLRVRRSPDSVAYRDYDRSDRGWRDHTWRGVAERVDRFRCALSEEGLKAGHRVAILLANGIDWACLDIAAHALGLVVVGLFPRDSVASNAYILGHSDARLMLLDSEERWQGLRRHRSEFPLLVRVWLQDGNAATASQSGEPIVRRLVELLSTKSQPPPLHVAAPDDLATLIYTSGTTGQPKGVMLSHRAILWNAESSAIIVPPRPNDVFLSVLPLAHAFERTVGYYLPMMGGCTIAFARSPDDLREDLATVRPTVLLGVPRLFELMSAAVARSVERSVVKHSLLLLTIAIGWKRFEAEQHNRSPNMTVMLLWPLLQRYVAEPVLANLGGRLRVAISGGAPLDKAVARLFISLGLPIVEGYGLTEAAPVVAANSVENNVPGSVGPPLPGVEIKLAMNGELLVRSPSIMKGYWKDEGRTDRALDAAGWFSTGDLAKIRKGRIFITGCLAETIVLSIGEKIDPNIVEAAIARDPLFEQVAVFGNHRPFLVALIVLNSRTWEDYARDKGFAQDHPNDPAATANVLFRIASLLGALPHFAQVRSVHLTLAPWTIEAGLLTPTLKVKRHLLQTTFARELDALYASSH